jgi:hypothetical protein
MELLNYEITFEHLIILVAILYILMFIIKRKEGFETEVELKTKQEQQQLKNIIQQKTRACREESINHGFLHYAFNSPAVPRR